MRRSRLPLPEVLRGQAMMDTPSYCAPLILFSTGLRHALLWMAEGKGNSDTVGWGAPGSGSHSSLETNGHRSVHCCLKVWPFQRHLAENHLYLSCQHLSPLRVESTWVSNFTPSLTSYNILSSFAWPASLHSVLFTSLLHTFLPCFWAPASSFPSLPLEIIVSVPYTPDFIPCLQLSVSFLKQGILSQ